MKKTLSWLLIFMMAISLLGGCTAKEEAPAPAAPAAPEATAEPATPAELSGAEATETDTYKDTVIIGMSASCPNIDPYSNTDQSSKILWKVMHLPLVTQDENLALAPGVAESWEQPDDSTYMFKIRQGMKFHNGYELTAADVVFTFTKGAESSFLSTVCGAIESITADDDYTVTMKIKKPNPDFVKQLYNYSYVILSEKTFNEDPENFYKIGCGAYKLDEFVLNDHASFTKFEDFYRADDVKTNHLYFRYIPEDSARVIALQNKEIDICLNPSTIDLTYIKDASDLELYSVNQTNISFIAFNLNNEKLQNVKLRQAISCAINRADLITVALEGQGSVASTFWIPAVFGYADDFDTYSYDLEKAKSLMAESGCEGITLVATVADSTYQSVAEIMQSQLKEIGITLEINLIDTAAMAGFLKAGEHELFIRGNSYSLPFSAYNMLYPGKGTNYAFYNNADVCTLLDQASSEFDETVRAGLYRDVQIQVAEEMPYVPLFYRLLNWGAVDGFGGLIANPSGPHEFTYCYVIEK